MRFLPPRAAMAYGRIGFLGVILILVLFMVPALRYTLVQVPVDFLATWVMRLAGVPPVVWS
jgi:hypothetical protein